MTANEQDLRALERCCCGNREAMEWLTLWRQYVHAIDDIVDGDTPGTEPLLASYALAISVYTHPFFLKNISGLRQIALNCTNAYADAELFKKGEPAWQREFADHYRHFGAEMVLAVASICGGYAHMRSLSAELRVICWHEHHTPSGEAI